MKTYGTALNAKRTPQTQKAFGKDQVLNNAGGYVFALSDEKALERFLILGAEGGTYYVSERDLTLENTKLLQRLLAADPTKFVNTIVRVSDAGRAPKNDAALFALALAAANKPSRKLAYEALPKVARTGTHLFQFMANLDSLVDPGSKTFRKGIANWYLGKDTKALAYQMLKYQNRVGWSHRDVLRLAHIKPTNAVYDFLFTHVVKGVDGVLAKGYGKEVWDTDAAALVARQSALMCNPSIDPKVAVAWIEEVGLTREMLPTELLKSPEVWEALLQNMPLHALVRNLGNLSKVGLLAPLSDGQKLVTQKLSDAEYIKKSRLHPFSILVALKTYASGQGLRGSGSWEVNQKVVDALDGAFCKAFEFVEPTGKKVMLALDISGSMGSAIGGLPLTAREVAAAMAMTFLKTEEETFIVGYHHDLMPLKIGAHQRLDDVVGYTSRLGFGSTNCALPWQYAVNKGIDLDAVISITDNETYGGTEHVFQAVKRYRSAGGRAAQARSVVIGTTSTGFTINDPSDPLGLDVVGMDTSVPQLVADFIRG